MQSCRLIDLKDAEVAVAKHAWLVERWGLGLEALNRKSKAPISGRFRLNGVGRGGVRQF